VVFGIKGKVRKQMRHSVVENLLRNNALSGTTTNMAKTPSQQLVNIMFLMFEPSSDKTIQINQLLIH